MDKFSCINESKIHSNNNQHQPSKINLAFADRLKPNCTQQRSSFSAECSDTSFGDDSSASLNLRIERQRSNPYGSPSQYRAKAIIRKYRRHVRHVEFKRLRSIVPAVAGNEKASQVRHIIAIFQTNIYDIKMYRQDTTILSTNM